MDHLLYYLCSNFGELIGFIDKLHIAWNEEAGFREALMDLHPRL